MYGVKAYDDYIQMAQDNEANLESLATFNTDYWTIVNGYPMWNNLPVA